MIRRLIILLLIVGCVQKPTGHNCHYSMASVSDDSTITILATQSIELEDYSYSPQRKCIYSVSSYNDLQNLIADPFLTPDSSWCVCETVYRWKWIID